MAEAGFMRSPRLRVFAGPNSNCSVLSTEDVHDPGSREQRPVQSALPDDGHHGADADLFVVRDGNRDRRPWDLFLHDDMAAALADFLEAMRPKDGTQLTSA